MSTAPSQSPAPSPVIAISDERPARAQSLPQPLTSLIGRERELADVRDLLRQPEVRLVTLIGAGGVGKTRLVLSAAAEVADSFDDGVTFIPLAPIGSATLVSITIARAVGVREGGGRSLRDRLYQELRDKQMLFVLDNFEHVIAAAAVI